MSASNNIEQSLTALLLYAGLFFVGAVSIQSALAQEHQSSDGFYRAKAIDRPPPVYPIGQRRALNAGMVDVSFMVGSDGTVFEPIVTHSSNSGFEKPALKAVARYLYSPAQLNGKAIESMNEIRILFEIRNSEDVVDARFASKYRIARKELEKESPDKARIAKLIKSMVGLGHLTPYAYAHLNLIKFLYASKFDDMESQINAMEQMLLFEGRTGKKGKFLKDELARSVREKLFVLNVRTERFGDAVNAYHKLKEIFPEAEQKYAGVMSEINEIRNSERMVSIDLSIHSRGYISIDLFKNTFSFEEVDGALNGAKLRCRKKFSNLTLRDGIEYRTPDSWGKCQLQIIGEPDTKFRLLQF